MFDNRKTLMRRPILAELGLALLVLAVIGGIAWNVATPLWSSKSVDDTRQVLAALDDLRLETDRAESRQWAYFLTRDRIFLAERDAALTAVSPALRALVGLTIDNSEQQHLLEKLRTALDHRLSLLSSSQAALDNGSANDVAALIRNGRAAGEAARAIMQQIENQENALLVTRQAGERSRLQLVFTGIALLLTCIVVQALRLRRSNFARLAGEPISKQVREVVLKAGALQAAIFNSANFSSIATDAQGVIQIFNVGAERMLGYRADEVVDQRTPADISDAQEVVARATALSLELNTPIKPGFEALVFKASRGIEDIYELTYIRKDGSRFPAVVSVTALRDAKDAVIGFLLIGTDNTARKQVEAEQAILDLRLRDQQYYTRSLIESNLDALMTTDPKGIITDVNKQMEALTGCTRDELIGAPFKSYFTDPQRAEAGINLVLATKKVIDYELIVRSKDGNETMVSYNASTFYNRDRQLQGVFAAARDITIQKQASQYARSLIEASLDPLVTISPDGKIMDVNAATVKVTGVVREELLGSDFLSYFTEPAKARDGYQQVFAKGFVADYPLTIRQRDGRLIDVLYNASVYKDVEGNVLGVFAAARDITERKQFETSLKEYNVELEMAKAVAEKANLAKSDFLSSMSHELRTPLNAVLGFAQLMESGGQTVTPAQKMSIDQILKAGWHLLNLINEILDLAVVESGKASISMEPVLLNLLLQDCQAMIAPLAQKRGIQMTFPNDSHAFCVRADRTRLKQVMINLLSNAIKYNRINGTVIVQCAMTDKNRTRISVKDTGEGLSLEQLAQLFQSFNRLGRERATEEGSGIGLVVTKQLVELMSGEVGVESTIGVGSTFWIELDAAQAQELLIQKAVESKVGGGLDEPNHVAEHALPMHRTMLYVEDEPANLLLVQQLIAQRGDIKLLSAANGKQGIESARAHHPDVILMDINLPDISGFDVIKLLREDPATAHITVMALSANAMPLDVKKGLQAGFFRYLTKPINIGEFMRELDAAFLDAAEKSPSSKEAAT